METLSSDEIARIVYLVLLGAVLSSYALLASRGRVGTMLRHAILWALLFTGVVAAHGIWETMTPRMVGVQQVDGRAIEIRRGRDGHFHLSLDITGEAGAPAVPIRFILDTGATDMVLTREDAAKLGYPTSDLAFLGTARTANGVTRTAQVRLDRVQLGASEQRNVRALVNEGDLHVSLLGMGYLSRFSRLEIAGDRLRIEY
jgi:aspartyl protease family protein